MSLRELYQEMIVDHGKTPRNKGEMLTATHSQIGHNPLCGDQLKLFVLKPQEIIEKISFEGRGCAISVASASLMTESVKGKSAKEVAQLFGDFLELVTTGKANHEVLGKLAVFAGVYEFPIRVKCATLCWHTLKAALNREEQIISTE